MFDFNKIKIQPSYWRGYEPPATDEQINELENYCGHKLPDNYKIILKKYNGCKTDANRVGFLNADNIPVERNLHSFFSLTIDKSSPVNIWRYIERFGQYLGANTLPFAKDEWDQIYYFKWSNNSSPEIYFLQYLEVDEPQIDLIAPSFDDFLNALEE